METQSNLLINDYNALEDGVESIIGTIEELNIQKIPFIGPLLGVAQNDTYSSNQVLEERLTLRQCNRDYSIFKGCKYGRHDIPEFDRCITKGCISPLRRFNNIIGHFEEMQYESDNKTKTQNRTVSLKPQFINDLKEFGESLHVELGVSIRKGRLWNIQNTSLCSSNNDSTWIYNSTELSKKLSTAFNLVSKAFPAPLSAHTFHAWLESEEAKDSISALKIYKQPQETTAVPGLLGTLQNNQLIDLAQEDKDEDVDINRRYENMDIPSFLCKGHTAHSGEAGRIRRVCDKVGVRILNDAMIRKLAKALEIAEKFNNDKKQWLLYCMGKFSYCTSKAILKIRDFLISTSYTTIHSATIHINSELHCAIISISSGVLVRREMNNILISTTSFYSDDWPDNKYIATLPKFDFTESLQYYFSTYFLLVPYIQFDRPPRTLMASVQSIQAVSSPFGAGTSSVCATEICKPLIYTPLYKNIMDNKDFKFADYLPGQELMICFANFNETDEDSIMINAGSTARGLYSYLAYSVNLINSNEKVPEVGEYAHIGTNRWWKSYSRRHKEPIQISKPILNDKKVMPICAGGDGRGRIISSNVTQTGQISVKTLRYSTVATGDKLATPHGQKGVVTIIPETNMPWGIDENGETIKFDIIVSLSSIVNRITVGQYYEMVAATRAIKEGKRIIVGPMENHNDHTETVLYNGCTGEIIERENGVPVQASWGISRVWQMTQMTWDKQHYTHNTAGNSSLNAPMGRSAGGGIKIGEMDSHAMESSGLRKVNEELQKRKTLIDKKICTNCNEDSATCACGDQQILSDYSISSSTLLFNYANVITSGYTTKYNISF